MLDNAHSLRAFLPELIVAGTVLAVLFVDLLARRPHVGRAAALTAVGLVAAGAATVMTMRADGYGLFFGLIARDPLADFFKLLFLATNLLVVLISLRAREATDESAAEFFALTLTTTAGMMLMASATDLLTAFLSLETVSIMSYVLAGFRRRSRESAEAALKYVIYGGVASGVMLYGMSLLYGLAGSTSFTAVRLACAHTPAAATVLLAVVLCLAGFGYKIASVPFHMWCPDVYQGAPTPVTAFLSVGPKAAGFALLVRFFGGSLPAELVGAPAPWPILLGLIAAATMTVGNLAALAQTNLKRLLAYSSIAHAGYVLLALCAGGSDGTRAILLYLVTYLFMNLGAFLVIIAVADAGIGEEIAEWRGLGRRAPWAAVAMAIFLFSLTGLPPLAGFFGKFYVFAALLARGGSLMVTLAVIGILNSAVSLYFYARVLKAMYFEAPTVDEPLPLARLHAATLALLAVPTVALFLVWSPLQRFVDSSLGQWYPAEMRPRSAQLDRSVKRSSVQLANTSATK
ncbi:MAG: proton-translocating NADH-quinone oxidoreductase, chain [Myxococcales bacterium]|nr:proton-translocating NADH-quinone oxidoreductase, chain [Myxococcales bacterium]